MPELDVCAYLLTLPKYGSEFEKLFVNCLIQIDEFQDFEDDLGTIAGMVP
jgi:hypothetical protein